MPRQPASQKKGQKKPEKGLSGQRRAKRGELLKRFLVEDGVGKDVRFWKLAQSLAALYPPGTDERRWVEGILARKKGLGL
jgi:hypothetical protein